MEEMITILIAIFGWLRTMYYEIHYIWEESRNRCRED